MTLAWLQQRQSAKWRFFDPDVLPAWIAEMDFPLAEPIADALRQAIDLSDLGYRSELGLGEATAECFQRMWGWSVDPRRVMSVSDVVVAVSSAVSVLTSPGDAVVIMPPVYPPFFESVTDSAGRALVEVPLLRDDSQRMTMDLDGLAVAFARPEVTACILCSPHNPTGTVFTREELTRLDALAAELGVAVIADEIHAALTLPGETFVPYLAVAPADARAVVVTSASKAWNTPGLKCAQVIGTDATGGLLRTRIPHDIQYGAAHVGVIGAVAAYRDGDAWLRDVIDVIDANMRWIEQELPRRLPMAGFVRPQASYLAWVDLGAYGLGDNPAAVIQERGRVALSEGHTYGQQGRGFVRINAGTSPAILTEILERMERGIESAA
jgi:cystathionine beta-lyase